VYRRPAGNYRNVLGIGRDIDRILTFIELDPANWHAGFRTLEEMYAWVLTSPYFSGEPYLEQGSRTRSRTRKRTTMKRFVEWLDEQQTHRTVEYQASGYLPEVFAAFPDARLKAAIEEEDSKAARSLIVKEKFNGTLVSTLIPSLQGKSLGEFIRTLRKTEVDFEAWVIATPREAIHKRVLDYYALFSSGKV